MSRINTSAITVTMVVPHGVKTYGCCACCYAPAACPGCAICPCIKDPEYIIKEMEASKYIYVRENSLEWNSPLKTAKEGDCFGTSCCLFRAQDNVSVLYFDDPMFDSITDKTPCCNGMATCICGGQGELIQVSHCDTQHLKCTYMYTYTCTCTPFTNTYITHRSTPNSAAAAATAPSSEPASACPSAARATCAPAAPWSSSTRSGSPRRPTPSRASRRPATTRRSAWASTSKRAAKTVSWLRALRATE